MYFDFIWRNEPPRSWLTALETLRDESWSRYWDCEEGGGYGINMLYIVILSTIHLHTCEWGRTTHDTFYITSWACIIHEHACIPYITVALAVTIAHTQLCILPGNTALLSNNAWPESSPSKLQTLQCAPYIKAVTLHASYTAYPLHLRWRYYTCRYSKHRICIITMSSMPVPTLHH